MCPAILIEVRNNQRVDTVRRSFQSLADPGKHGRTFGFGIARRITLAAARARLRFDPPDRPSFRRHCVEQGAHDRRQPPEARDQYRRTGSRQCIGFHKQTRKVRAVAALPGLQFLIRPPGPAEKGLLVAGERPTRQ